MASQFINGSYDVIVVGAGIAGLIAAAYLTREGANVCVLESNHQAGGCMAGIRRRGFYFDVGDQSFEQANLLFPILEDLKLLDRLQFLPARYRLKTPGMDTEIRQIADLRDAFIQAYPADADATRLLFSDLERRVESLRPLFDRRTNPLGAKGVENCFRWFRLARILAPRLPLLKTSLTTRGNEFARHFFRDESEACCFLSRMGYKNMSLLLWLGFLYAWCEDYWYPVGGMEALIQALVSNIEAGGGEFQFKRRVASIALKGRRAEGVLLDSGELILARSILYTGDLKALYNHLLPHSHSSYTSAKTSEALTSVYVGLNISPERLRRFLPTHHLFYFPGIEIHDPDDTSTSDLHARAWIEISSPTVDPANENLAPPGQSSLVLQTMCSAEWLDGWKTRGATDRRAYRQLKERVAREMIGTLGQVIPGVGDHVEYFDVGSPLSAERFTHNSGGASAGWSFDPESSPLRNRLIAMATPIENLTCAGHYAIWPGSVPTAALSGKLAAERVLGRPTAVFLSLLEKWLPDPLA